MDLDFIRELIRAHGYWALFIGAFIEGETFCILGGIAASQGLLDIWGVAIYAMAGGIAGDQFFFYLGRLGLITKSKSIRRLSERIPKAKAMVERHSMALIIFSRFMYGLRAVIPMACGVVRVGPWKFGLLNLLSAMLWSSAFSAAGFLLGGYLSNNSNLLDFIQGMPIILPLALATIILSGRLLLRRMGDWRTKSIVRD